MMVGIFAARESLLSFQKEERHVLSDVRYGGTYKAYTKLLFKRLSVPQ